MEVTLNKKAWVSAVCSLQLQVVLSKSRRSPLYFTGESKQTNSLARVHPVGPQGCVWGEGRGAMKFKLFQLGLCDSQRGKLPLPTSSPFRFVSIVGRAGWGLEPAFCGTGRLGTGASFLFFVPQHLQRSGVRLLRFPLIQHRAVLRAPDNGLVCPQLGEPPPQAPWRLSPHPLLVPFQPNPPSVPVTSGPGHLAAGVNESVIVQRIQAPPSRSLGEKP